MRIEQGMPPTAAQSGEPAALANNRVMRNTCVMLANKFDSDISSRMERMSNHAVPLREPANAAPRIPRRRVSILDQMLTR